MPYNLSSSASSNRKSEQFVSPVTDYEVSSSAVKRADTSKSLLRTTLADLQNLKSADNDESLREDQNDQPVKSVDQRSCDNSANQQKVDPVNRNEDDDLFDSEIDRLFDADSQITNAKSTCETSNQAEVDRSQPVDDYQFSSESERIFERSRLASQLGKQFPSRTLSQQSNGPNRRSAIRETRYDQVDDELSRLNEQTEDADDELFDSDAVNNEESSDERSIDEFEEKNCRPPDDAASRFASAYGGYPTDDLVKLGTDEFESDELLGIDLDDTLIKSDDPAEDEFITQPTKPFDPNDCDFKTAAGNPIKVNMSEQEQIARAKSLGISSEFDFKSQAFH